MSTASPQMSLPLNARPRFNAATPRELNDVGNSQVVQLSFPFFEEEDQLVSRSVVVPHPDPFLVPDEWLPELESCLLRHGLRDESCLGIAEQVKMSILS